MTYIPNVTGLVASGNSYTSTLGANATFTGTALNVTDYSNVTVTVESNADSAACGVQIQFSSDGTNWDQVVSYTYFSSQNFVKSVSIRSEYLRIVYTNSSTVQTSFRLQTIVHISTTSTHTSQLVHMDHGITDAFGRLRVSNPINIIEINYVKGSNNIQISKSTTGTGAIALNANSPFIQLSVATGADQAIEQSRQRGIYQPGKSILVFNTGILNYSGTNGTGVSSRIGYYDTDDGIFFEHQGDGGNGTMYVVKRSSGTGVVVETRIEQKDWNIDPLNGSGSSGITIDPTKVLIYVIDFQWLGSGMVRCGYIIAGQYNYCHAFLHSNIETKAFINLGSQPVRYEIVSTSGAGSMTHICSSVMSEGGFNLLGNVFSASQGTTTKLITSTVSPVICIKLKSTGTFPKVNVVPLQVHSLVTTGGNLVWYIYFFRDTAAADILTNENFLSAGTESAVEYDVSATAFSTTGSTLVNSGFISNNNDFFNVQVPVPGANNISLTTNLSGVSDVLVIAMAKIGGGTESVTGSITWRELI